MLSVINVPLIFQGWFLYLFCIISSYVICSILCVTLNTKGLLEVNIMFDT